MERQIFQTDNSTRWKRFKWTLRIIGVAALLLCAACVMMLVIDKMPDLPFKDTYRSAISASSPLYQETRLSKEYRGFRQHIHDKKMHNDYEKVKASRNMESLTKRQGIDRHTDAARLLRLWSEKEAGIRAAFYVGWDKESYYSLKRNAKHLNLVIPEWLFLTPQADSVTTTIDRKGLRLMQRAGLPIMPMLSNNYKGEFDGAAAGRLLHDANRRHKITTQLVQLCKKHRFAGINLDLEELDEQSDEYLIRFVRELATAFHANGLLLSVDAIPFNADYNLREIAAHCDFIILMAYDEYTASTAPGPVSSQRWIEAAVDQALRQVPAEKLVLGMGAYGYEWSKKGSVEPSLSYHDALTRAAASHSTIHFDNDTYNLNFAYYDEGNILHQVYFNDAATLFNIMRFGQEEGVAGFALWRMGSEDQRTWSFYDRPMDKESMQHFDFAALRRVKAMTGLDYVGEGEVLNIINTPQSGRIEIDIDSSAMLISEQRYKQIPTAYQVQRFGYSDRKKICLTFDDGPDPVWTPKILDILQRYDVPAAFFLVGIQAEQNLPIVREEYKRGYLLGNHTFTHPNIAEISSDRTALELRLTRLLIEAVTGHSTILFRAPYNADSEPSSREEVLPVILARQQNYLDIGESIDPEDWEPGITADSIVARVLRGVEGEYGNIILLHDAGGDTRKATVEALPIIIEKLRAKGYTFTTLSDLMNRPKSDLMPAVKKGRDYYLMQANLALASGIYACSKLLYALFILFMLLGFGRLAVMVALTIRERRKERCEASAEQSLPTTCPKVSIIVPAYNEEVNAVASLRNLLRQDYSNYDIVFVDDGSKDNTFVRVQEAFGTHPQVCVLTKPNGGKASALNYGISKTEAEYVVCIDADTKLYPDAVRRLMSHFLQDADKAQVGAVAGNVKVGNCINTLTRWQSIEYTTSQNFDRMAYAAINAITVVPGAIGAFRKSVILQVGSFTTDTLAEDCDLTIRILRAGFTIKNENKAIAVTEAPETLGQFKKQRIRWSFGVMQTFWKHRDTLFNTRYKGLGLWAMPCMMIFQFIIPYFSPLADIAMICGLFMGNAERILLYYALFTLTDCSVSIAAFLFEKEKLGRLFWLVPQRFGYRWIMYEVMFRSLLKAIKGQLQSWGVLTRTGTVKDV